MKRRGDACAIPQTMPIGPPSVKAVLVLAATLSMSSLPAAQNAGHDEPRMPFIASGACSFEGCSYGEWTANSSVALRRERDTWSPVVFRLAKGARVTALTGDVIVLRPGRVQFKEATDLTSADGSIRATPGDVLYLLSYIGEGYSNAWFKGRLYREADDSKAFFNALCDSNPDRCTGPVVEPTQSEWWIKIRSSSGRVGWTNEPAKFDGKDRFGL